MYVCVWQISHNSWLSSCHCLPLHAYQFFNGGKRVFFCSSRKHSFSYWKWFNIEIRLKRLIVILFWVLNWINTCLYQEYMKRHREIVHLLPFYTVIQVLHDDTHKVTWDTMWKHCSNSYFIHNDDYSIEKSSMFCFSGKIVIYYMLMIGICKMYITQSVISTKRNMFHTDCIEILRNRKVPWMYVIVCTGVVLDVRCVHEYLWIQMHWKVEVAILLDTVVFNHIEPVSICHCRYLDIDDSGEKRNSQQTRNREVFAFGWNE